MMKDTRRVRLGAGQETTGSRKRKPLIFFKGEGLCFSGLKLNLVKATAKLFYLGILFEKAFAKIGRCFHSTDNQILCEIYNLCFSIFFFYFYFQPLLTLLGFSLTLRCFF